MCESLVIGVFLLSLSLLTLAFLVAPKFGFTIGIMVVVFFGVGYGAFQTQYFAAAMRFVDPRIAASMYAILMAFTNIGQGIGMYLSGALVDLTDFSMTYLILSGLNLFVLPFLPMVFGTQESVAEEV